MLDGWYIQIPNGINSISRKDHFFINGKELCGMPSGSPSLRHTWFDDLFNSRACKKCIELLEKYHFERFTKSL